MKEMQILRWPQRKASDTPTVRQSTAARPAADIRVPRTVSGNAESEIARSASMRAVLMGCRFLRRSARKFFFALLHAPVNLPQNSLTLVQAGRVVQKP
jgi:hypothetical protein